MKDKEVKKISRNQDSYFDGYDKGYLKALEDVEKMIDEVYENTLTMEMFKTVFKRKLQELKKENKWMKLKIILYIFYFLLGISIGIDILLR